MKRIEPILTISTAITFLVLAATGCGGGAPTETTYEDSLNEAGLEDDHGESRIIRIDSEDSDRLGLQLSEAGPGDLEITVELPGEVVVWPRTDRPVRAPSPGGGRVPRLGNTARGAAGPQVLQVMHGHLHLRDAQVQSGRAHEGESLVPRDGHAAKH